MVLLAPALYLLFWNVDFSILLGAAGAAVVSVGRWIAIVATLLACAFALPRGAHLGRFGGLCAMIWLLAPSVVFSEDVAQSSIEFVRVFSLLVLFWIVSDRPGLGGRLYWLIGGFAALVSLASLAHLDLGAHRTGLAAVGRFRGAGITPHPNNLGFIASIAAAFGLSMLIGQRQRTGVELAAMLTVIGAAALCLYGSDSRTALLSTLIISGMFLIIRLFHGAWRTVVGFGPGWRTLIFWVAVLAMCAPLILTLAGGDGEQFATSSSYAASNAARVTLWRNALLGFEEHPLTGGGLGLSIQETYDPLLKIFNVAPYAHDAILNMMYICGVPGLLFLAIIVAACVGLMLPDRRRFVLALPVEQWYLFSSVVVATLFSSIMEGGLQNNYGMNCFIAVALGALAGARTPRPVRRPADIARHRRPS